MTKIKTFLKTFFTSRSMIRLYKVFGFGVLAVFITQLISMVPMIGDYLSPEVKTYVIMALTSILAAVNKKRRELRYGTVEGEE